MFSRPDIVGRSQTDKLQLIFTYCYAYSLSWPLPALPTRERWHPVHIIFFMIPLIQTIL
jgi:hypothetical protein